MKLNSLASAVSISLAALALTACGGNDSNTTASTPAPAPAPKPIETPKPVDPNTATTPNKEGDTSSLPNNPNSSVTTVNTKLANFDAAKTVSSGSTSYIRRDDSNYDRAVNPSNTGRMSAALAGDLNDQNPYLSNYLIGSESDSSGKVMGTDYLGAVVSGRQGVRGAVGSKKTLSNEIDNDVFTTTSLDGSINSQGIVLSEGAVVDTPISLLSNSMKIENLDLRDNNRYSIQDVNRNHVNVANVLGKQANTAIRVAGSSDRSNYDLLGDTGLVGYRATASGVTGTSEFALDYGLPENDPAARFKDYQGFVFGYQQYYDEIVKSTDPAVTQTEKAAAQARLDRLKNIGIVDPLTNMNAKAVSEDEISVIYNTKPTRIFGKNYKDYTSDAGVKDPNTGKVVDQNINTYVNSYQATDRQTADNKLELLTATPIILKDVQYGRLTSNIDAIARDLDPNRHELYYRSFINAGTPGSVDVYYSRGTNSTTLDQMKAVKEAAKGAKIEYRGHALTYGIAPNASIDADVLKNSFGEGKEISTFGNFVHATYDTAANKLNGNIYNFINADVTKADSKYYRNDLASFDGDVVGNTVVNGKSTYQNQTGSFAASFYGDAAQELGGQLSSVANGYGAAKWGAVFGAQKVGANSNQEINQQKK